MLKKYLITFCFILSFSISLIAQECKPSYFKYYLNIYRAENKICNNELDSALFYYNKSFKDFETKFYYDLFNAALCAYKVNNHKELGKILIELSRLGYKLDFIDNNRLRTLDSLNNNQYLRRINKLRNNFYENIDTNLSSECNRRVDEDQNLNKKRTNNYKRESTKEFHDNIYKNIVWLTKIIDSCGYPNRKLIGEAYVPTYSVVGIMIIHFYQNKAKKVIPEKKFMDWANPEDSIINIYDSIPLLSILSKEVKIGNMNLGEHVKYHNWARTIEDGKYFYKTYYNSNKYPVIFSIEEDSILINYSVALQNSINDYEQTGKSEFRLGKCLYKLKTMEDYKSIFESKFGKK